MSIAKERRSYEEFMKHLDFVQASTDAGNNPFESVDEKLLRKENLVNRYDRFFEYYFPHYCTDENMKFSSCADFHVEFAHMVKQDQLITVAQQWGRGLAKSVHTDMGIPIWLWAQGEKLFEVIIGNNENAALKLLDDVRAEFTANERLIADYGKQQLLGQWEEGDFKTKDGRFIGKALGMGQNTRGLRDGGQRPNYVAADDLEDAKTVKNPARQNEISEWLRRAVIPMMVGPVRRFLFANNYFAPQTIQSLLIKKMPSMKVHRVNACDKNTFEPVWPERDSKEKYKIMAATIGMLPFLSEYCNEPHIEGSIFLASDIIYLKPSLIPRFSEFDAVFGYWDVAYGGTDMSDYNAIVIFGAKNDKYYHIDSFCAQSKMEVALEWLAEWKIKQRSSRPVHLYYESQFWNDSVTKSIKAVERKKKISFNFIKHIQKKAAKYDRILTLQPYFQRKEIFFREFDMANPFAQVGLSQLFAIEPGYKSHDDWPDALESLIKLLEQFTKSSQWDAPRTGGDRKNKYNH